MKAFIKSWSITTEFAIVIAIAFGPFILNSFAGLGAKVQEVAFTDRALLGIVATELCLGLPLLLFLKLRGWNWADFKLDISWRSTVDALAVLGGTYVVVIASHLFASLFIGEHALNTVDLRPQAGMWAATCLSLVNALYEELFVTAYVIETLEKHQGALIAIFVSALIRMSYHVYQGPLAIVNVLPIGLLYAFVFWRWKKLWPIVLAHALVDFLSLNFGS